MMRRTFPRAAAAGLVAVALGHAAPAAAQQSTPAQNRITLTIGFNTTGGLTGSLDIATTATTQLPVAPMPREVVRRSSAVYPFVVVPAAYTVPATAAPNPWRNGGLEGPDEPGRIRPRISDRGLAPSIRDLFNGDRR